MWRVGYRLLLWLAFPFVLARLWWRGRREPRYRENPGERFGFYRTAPARPVIWLHAVSLGETRAAEPLLRALQQHHPDCDLLITQMTATGREAAEQLLGGTAQVAWLAYDYPSAVRRFLRHFRPRLGILMETEIWFHLVAECNRLRVPLMLANARMSAKSARGYAVVGPLVRDALGGLSAVAAQTVDDAERLRALGARAVEVTGNLKFDDEPAGGSESLAAQFKQWFGTRRISCGEHSRRRGGTPARRTGARTPGRCAGGDRPAPSTTIRRCGATHSCPGLEVRAAECRRACRYRLRDRARGQHGRDGGLLSCLRCGFCRRKPAPLRRAEPDRGLRCGRARPCRPLYQFFSRRSYISK